MEPSPLPPARTRTRTTPRHAVQPRYNETIELAERGLNRRQNIAMVPTEAARAAGESHAGFYTGIAGGAFAGLMMPIIAAVAYASKQNGQVSTADVLGSGEGIGSMLGGAVVGGALVAVIAGNSMSSTTRKQVAAGAVTGLVIGIIVAATNPDNPVTAEIIPLIMGAGAIAGPFLLGFLDDACGGYVSDSPANHTPPAPGEFARTAAYTNGLRGIGPSAGYIGPQAPQNNG